MEPTGRDRDHPADDLRLTSEHHGDPHASAAPNPTTTRTRDAAADRAATRQAAQQAAAARLARFTPDGITVNIIRAIARGESRLDVAASARVSESTARRKLAHARRAWGVETNTEVVVTAVRVGLI